MIQLSDPRFAAVADYIHTHWDQTVRHGETAAHIDPLPGPHTVPCINGHFIALFYWDTYFTNVGLLMQDRVDLARANCDAMIHLIEKKGFIPNSTFKRDDTRSQPPYFGAMVRDVFEVTQDTHWLARAAAALEKEWTFWIDQRSAGRGLSRHGHHADRAYLIEFFDRPLVSRLKMNADAPEEAKLEIAAHYLAEAETGWDFNPRFGGRCHHFAQVELNSTLYLTETSLAQFARALGQDESVAHKWEARAAARRDAMHQWLWREEEGLFYDFDVVRNQRSAIATLGAFHPLWTGAATPEQAAQVRANLHRFERQFGVAVCEPNASDVAFQWNYPNGWPPLFFITVRGLKRAGFVDDARRIARQYCDLVTRHFERTGKLWEKFDVATGDVAGGEYEAQPMLGWTAGVFLACAAELEAER